MRTALPAQRRPRPTARWWPSLVLAALVVLLVLPNRAAAQTFNMAEALATLTHYDLVRGDTTGDLMLGQPITRAQLATIMVRSLGYETEAQLAFGSVAFPDTQDHWASGYVHIARNLGLASGYPDGTFQPDREVTHAEMLTFLLRLADKEPTTGQWPQSVLLQAEQLGIAPPGLPLLQIADQPARRSEVFASFYLTLTAVPSAESGKTLLQKLDTEPPRLELGAVPAETSANQIIITGVVSGDTKEVRVADSRALLDADGFRAILPLQEGENNFAVVAVDMAGNQTVKELTVARIPPVVRLEITGPATLNSSATGNYSVRAFDARGREVPGRIVEWRYSGAVAAFNAETGALRAAAQSGTITLEVQYEGLAAQRQVAVLGPSPAATTLRIASVVLPVGEVHTVEVEVVDDQGVRVRDDYGRAVNLSVDQPGILIIRSPVESAEGLATFQVFAPAAGNARFTAISPGLQTQTVTVDFRPPYSVRLEALQNTVEFNQSARIRGVLIDAWGKATNNPTDAEISLQLNVTGVPGTLSSNTLRIPSGRSSSSDVTLRAGTAVGTIQVTGTLTSPHPYPIETTGVAVTLPQVGAARELRVTGPGNVAQNSFGLYTLQVLDASNREVRSGSVAFRLSVDASTSTDKVAGLPSGVTVRYGRNVPEAEVTSLDNAVFRTVNGRAQFYVRFSQSGSVTLLPVTHPGGSSVAGGNGNISYASPSTGVLVTQGTGHFQGTPVRYQLTASSPTAGRQSSHGGILARGSSSQYVTLRVVALDAQNDPVPGLTNPVTLERVSGDATTLPSPLSAPLENGQATFRIYPGDKTGTDQFLVRDASGLFSNTVAIAVQAGDAPSGHLNATIGRPFIRSISGVSADGFETPYVVQTSDLYLRLRLDAQPDGLVYARVYRDAAWVWTSEVIDSGGPEVTVDIPRAALSTGFAHFTVQLVNAVGNSPLSATSERVTIKTALSAAISSAEWNLDPASRTLTLLGTNFPVSDQPVLDATQFTIHHAAGTYSLSDSTGLINNNSRATINLGPADYDELRQTARYHTAPTLRASSGWVYNDAGEARPEESGIPIRPAGHISGINLDLRRNQVHITGYGLNTGNLNYTGWTFTEAGVTLPATASAWSISPQRAVVTISTGDSSLLQQNLAGSSITLSRNPGWLTSGSYGQNAAVAGISVNYRAEVTSVHYNRAGHTLILNGTGFMGSDGSGGSVDVGMLRLVDESDHPGGLQLVGSAEISDDTRVVITLDQTVYNVYEDPAIFAGSDIWLRAERGWWSDLLTGLPAPAIGPGALRAPQP